jgi:hypothetical protein
MSARKLVSWIKVVSFVPVQPYDMGERERMPFI